LDSPNISFSTNEEQKISLPPVTAEAMEIEDEEATVSTDNVSTADSSN
jgi:hypothetical protein